MIKIIYGLQFLYLVYAVAIFSSYLILALISYFEMRRYMTKNSFADYKMILSSPLAPSISLVAPAYNEGLTIIENVKSLMSIEYNNYDIIIVNDGSKDDSLEKMQQAFDLKKVDFLIDRTLPCNDIRAIYKSQNRAYKKLIVVDKVNGGKADALNAGINISNKELVACIDVDCIIQPDALLKMVKPYLEDRENTVAIGGVVRIANSCIVEEGRLIKVNLPESLLARFQVLEYMRSFLLGRMAWSRLNGLMLISGAFGLFKREVVLTVGGYDKSTVGEDMELVVRIRRKLTEIGRKAKVIYVPDPLCWTEAPSDRKILGRQRNRWMRGTIETLSRHRKICLNPKYGLLGVLSYPYWFMFELLAPWIELSGLLFFVYLTLAGFVNWGYTLTLLLFVYLFSIFISVLTLLFEEISFYRYTRQRDFYKMLATACLEPVLFHPSVMYWAIRGTFDKWRGRKSWGEMSRTGFLKKAEAK
ncbi:MAG: glycosyltransferase [Imperialibacter sp.]|uniref:glycosyltransferase family 2 protein n=1 Tax=Imperialibacter sp. TaxID=2038411 RepID=UPI0032EFB8D3